jgi:hypothetical protein
LIYKKLKENEIEKNNSINHFKWKNSNQKNKNQSEWKTNWRIDLKFWSVMHENQGYEIKKEKKKKSSPGETGG